MCMCVCKKKKKYIYIYIYIYKMGREREERRNKTWYRRVCVKYVKCATIQSTLYKNEEGEWYAYKYFCVFANISRNIIKILIHGCLWESELCGSKKGLEERLFIKLIFLVP